MLLHRRMDKLARERGRDFPPTPTRAFQVLRSLPEPLAKLSRRLPGRAPSECRLAIPLEHHLLRTRYCYRVCYPSQRGTRTGRDSNMGFALWVGIKTSTK